MTLKNNMPRYLAAVILVAGLTSAAPALAQDLALTQTTAFSTTVNFNQSKTYPLTVTNLGAAAATNVIVDGVLPASFVSYNSISGCVPTTAGHILPCKVTSSLAAGASLDLVVGVLYEKPDPYPTTCTATGEVFYGDVTFSVSAVETDPDLTNNSQTGHRVMQQPQADISVVTTGPAEVSHGGGTYTYPFTVTNHGPCDVTGTSVVIDDNVLSSAFTFKSAAGICSAITGLYLADFSDYQYCDTGALVSGASVTGAVTYDMAALPKDLIRSNQNAGMQIIYQSSTGHAWSAVGTWPYWDPTHGNDSAGGGDFTSAANASTGCSSAGGGASFFLLLMGMAAFYLARRRVA